MKFETQRIEKSWAARSEFYLQRIIFAMTAKLQCKSTDDNFYFKNVC